MTKTKTALTTTEQNETMLKTWGRIRTKLGYSSISDTTKDQRLKSLIDKFQKDLDDLYTDIVWEK